MKFKQTISLLLLMVYAFFFASTRFCYHAHILSDGKIVHSHLALGDKSHSHSSVQLQLIDQLNTVNYAAAEASDFTPVTLFCRDCILVIREASHLLQSPFHSFSLRAPPFFLDL